MEIYELIHEVRNNPVHLRHFPGASRDMNDKDHNDYSIWSLFQTSCVLRNEAHPFYMKRTVHRISVRDVKTYMNSPFFQEKSRGEIISVTIDFDDDVPLPIFPVLKLNHEITIDFHILPVDEKSDVDEDEKKDIDRFYKILHTILHSELCQEWLGQDMIEEVVVGYDGIVGILPSAKYTRKLREEIGLDEELCKELGSCISLSIPVFVNEE